MAEDSAGDRVCENCGRWIEKSEVLFKVEMQVFANPEPPEIDLDKTAEELRQEWDELMEQLANMDDQEVQEATDEVHESYSFSLCPECRKEMHRRIMLRKNLFSGD